jgi:hypothetical protein
LYLHGQFEGRWPSIEDQGLSESERETLGKEGKLEEIECKAIKQGVDLKGGMYMCPRS